MADPAGRAIADYRESNGLVRDLIYADVADLWNSARHMQPDRARQFVTEHVEEMIRSYGEKAAGIAADFYDDLRESESPKGRNYTAALAGAAAVQAIRTNLSWATAPMEQPATMLGALGRLKQVAGRMALQQGHDTVTLSAHGDPAKPRWARVPEGPDPCAFCRLLASRGFMYHSEHTAGGEEATQFHGDDACVAVPSWSHDPALEGYDPDAFYEQYLDARRAADGTSVTAITAALREQRGIH